MTENNLVTALTDTVGEEINNELDALKTVRCNFSPKFNKRMSKLVRSADSPVSLFMWRHSRFVKAAASAAAAVLVFIGSYAAYRKLVPKTGPEGHGYNIITDQKSDLSPITAGTNKYSFVQYGYSENTMLSFADKDGSYTDDVTYKSVKLDKKDVCTKVRELCGLSPADYGAEPYIPYNDWSFYTYYKDGRLLNYQIVPDNEAISITVYPDDACYTADFGDIPGSALSNERTVYYRYTIYSSAGDDSETEFELVNDRIGKKETGYEKYDFSFVYRGERPVTFVMDVATNNNDLSACRKQFVKLIDSIIH